MGHFGESVGPILLLFLFDKFRCPFSAIFIKDADTQVKLFVIRQSNINCISVKLMMPCHKICHFTQIVQWTAVSRGSPGTNAERAHQSVRTWRQRWTCSNSITQLASADARCYAIPPRYISTTLNPAVLHGLPFNRPSLIRDRRQ